MAIWKDCKYCGKQNGNCLTNCKICNNDRFWVNKVVPKVKEQEFHMKKFIAFDS